jgi:hypothetical protein
VTTSKKSAAVAQQMLTHLQNLIAAIDRRTPHLEQLGEEAIARDAAELRQRAMRLIQEIQDAAVPAPEPVPQVTTAPGIDRPRAN